MTAAVYYHPEAYSTGGPKLMGRNAAGESFLRGFMHYSQTPTFWVQVQRAEHAQHFAQTLRAYGRSEPVTAVQTHSLSALAQPGAVYYPGPGIGRHAWQRAAFGHGAWSLCGITHTTSSALAMDALAELLSAPVQPWDAVICTSNAVKHNVEQLLQAQAQYLQARLGASRMVLPQLPVIPLGIHTQDFVFTPAQRAQARDSLGVSAEAVVVLFMGRLSFHAKAHPLAMYQALEHAAQATQRQIVLVECGWHANEHIERAFQEGAQCACPSVRVITLDGRQAPARQQAWASADVFCSLSDNIQETFGIAPIEAMAAGLPSVVSDWDGYKDTVREGIDGFRVATLMPQAGTGGDLALRHALELDTYDMYCGHACSLVAVDVQATAQAFIRLVDNPELRQQMGQAARHRAQTVYDWRVIIPQYEQLWAQLSEIRAAQAPALPPLAHPWPARMDPMSAFASYPTQALTAQTRLALVDETAQQGASRLDQYRRLGMVSFARAVLPTQAECEQVLALLQSGPQPVEQLLLDVPQNRRVQVFRGLAWCLKMGVVKVST